MQLTLNTILVLVFALVELTLCSPAPILFGVSLTDPGGNVIGATNPAQTAALLGAGALAVAGGGLLGNLLTPRPTTTTTIRRRAPRRHYRRRHRYIYRRKRMADTEVPEIAEMMEHALKTLVDADPEDCYRRLVCDMAASGDEFFYSRPIINLVIDVDEEIEDALSEMAKKIQYEYSIAFKVGQYTLDSKFCDSVFACPITGRKLDSLVVEEMSKNAIHHSSN